MVPLIFIQRDNACLKADEVIDGKQRLTALWRWVHGVIPATIGGREYWYKDTTEIERRHFPNIKCAYIDLPERQRLQFYLLLNAGGTIHTDAEIEKVQVMLDSLS